MIIQTVPKNPCEPLCCFCAPHSIEFLSLCRCVGRLSSLESVRAWLLLYSSWPPPGISKLLVKWAPRPSGDSLAPMATSGGGVEPAPGYSLGGWGWGGGGVGGTVYFARVEGAGGHSLGRGCSKALPWIAWRRPPLEGPGPPELPPPLATCSCS